MNGSANNVDASAHADTERFQVTSLELLASEHYSRRQALARGAAAISTAALSASFLAACGDGDDGGSSPPPITVNAGQDGTASSGRLVTLAGITTGTLVGVRWEQISGPAVALTNADSTSATFIAPVVTSPVTLGFRFTATGGDGATVSDDTLVTINPAQLGFTAVAKNRNDRVTAPAGYDIQVIHAVGDPIKTNVSVYANNGGDTNYAGRIGDHHAAVHFFGLATATNNRDDASNTRGLLAVNHQDISQQYIHASAPAAAPRPEAEAIKEIEAHGLSVVEAAQRTGVWTYASTSALNWRVTPNTPVVFNGPARGDVRLRTRFSPTGVAGRGTISNSANGHTPWGTFLSCEEKWAAYFRRDAGDDAARSPAQQRSLNRYGIVQGSAGKYAWSTVAPAEAGSTLFSRWNASAITGPADGSGDFRNEPNQFGWVVEIDPYDASVAPRKRTALGRLAHDGAAPGRFIAGRRIAIYLSDDGRREYLYKFVSNAAWNAADAQVANRAAMGDKYLDAGTLYVARFDADGTGQWLPLTFGAGSLTPANPTYPFANQADVLTNARLAADALGATPMDRPEWTAVHPVSGEVYLSLTSNDAAGRPLAGTDPANPRHYNDPKGSTDQRGNPNGHIIRIRETGDTTEATSFTWDIYVFGAGRDLNPANINVSVLDDANDFSGPDALAFGRASNATGQVKPLLWVQTDDNAYTDVTNNQMLAGLPGSVGDGATLTINNVGADGTVRAQQTIAGRAPGSNLRRFLVGPVECEISGVDTTPDGRTLFVNIQHPGQGGTVATPTSNWPTNQAGAPTTARPRSALVAIRQIAGGVVGL